MTQPMEVGVTPPELWIGQNFARIRAQRLASEGGWTLSDIAGELTAAGCPMNKGSLSRIERGTQRIKYNEAEALAKLVGVPVDELAMPPEIAASAEARELVARWRAARQAQQEAHANLETVGKRVREIEESLARLIEEGPDERTRVIEQLRDAARLLYGANQDGQAAALYWIQRMTGSSADREAWLAHEGLSNEVPRG